jgi:stromal membrane-associated protein
MILSQTVATATTTTTTGSSDEIVRSESSISHNNNNNNKMDPVSLLVTTKFPVAVPILVGASSSPPATEMVAATNATATTTTAATSAPPPPPATQEELQLRLKALMNRPDNQICCDCSDRKPTWASLIVPPPSNNNSNTTTSHTSTFAAAQVMGAFCCYTCSGAHRGLGTHISFVRSIHLDTWKEKEVLAMERGGNKRVNAIFEAKWNQKGQKPTVTTDITQRTTYIRQKYMEKVWYDGSIYQILSTIQDAEPVVAPKSPSISISSQKKVKKSRMPSHSQPQPLSSQWSLHPSSNNNNNNNNNYSDHSSNDNKQQVLSQSFHGGGGGPKEPSHHWDPFAAMTNIPSPHKRASSSGYAGGGGGGAGGRRRAKDELSMSWHPSAVVDPIKATTITRVSRTPPPTATFKTMRSLDNDDDDFSVVSWKIHTGKTKSNTKHSSSSSSSEDDKVAFPEAAQESLCNFGHDHDDDEADDLFASPKPRGIAGTTWNATTTDHFPSESNLLVMSKGSTVHDNNKGNDDQHFEREALEFMGSDVADDDDGDDDDDDDDKDDDDDDNHNNSQSVSKNSSQGHPHMMVKSSSRVRTIKPTGSNSIASSSTSISSTSRRMMLRKTLSVPAINTHKMEPLPGRVRSSTVGIRQQQQLQHKGEEEARATVTVKLDDTWNEVADFLFKTKGGGDCDVNDGSDSSLGRSSRHGGSKGGGRRMLRRDRSDGSSDPLDTVSAHTSTSGSKTRKPDPPSSSTTTTTTNRRSHSSDAKRSTAGTRSSSSGRKPSHETAISLPFLDDAFLSPSNETRNRSQSPARTRTRSQSRSRRSTALSASAHNTRPRPSSKDALRKSRDPARRRCSNGTENSASSTPSTTSSTSTSTTTTSRKQRTVTPTRSSGTGLRRTRSNDMECRLLLDNEEASVTKKQTLGSSSSALSTPVRSLGARLRRTRSNDLECLSLGKEERATRKPTGGTSIRPSGRSNHMNVNTDGDTWAIGGKDSVTNHDSKAAEGKELNAHSSSAQAYSMGASGKVLKEFEDAVASSNARALGMSVSVGGKVRKGATTDPLGSRSEHHHNHNRQRSRSKSNGPRSRAARPRSLDPMAKAKERRSRRNASGVDDADDNDDGGADPPAPPPAEHPSLTSSSPPRGVRAGNPRMSLSRATSMSRLH